MDANTIQVLVDSGASGLIIALVQLVRKTVPKAWVRYLPLFALGFAEMYCHLMRPGASLAQNTFMGLLLGAAAVGNFSGVKNFFEKKKK